MKPRFFATPTAFRAWLQKNHARAKELLVGRRARSIWSATLIADSAAGRLVGPLRRPVGKS